MKKTFRILTMIAVLCLTACAQEPPKPVDPLIGEIRSHAIPFEIGEPLPKEITAVLIHKKIILVGEMHGTRQVPEVFDRLARAVSDDGSRVRVFLEIPQTSQHAIDRFLKTHKESALKKDSFFTRPDQDGRSSRAMMNLLESLSHVPNVKIFCMDPSSGKTQMDGAARDAAMAKFIAAHVAGADHSLVLTGNLHSSTSVGTKWNPQARPMGLMLKSMLPEIPDAEFLNILVRYEKIDSWNCQSAEAASCGDHPEPAFPTDYSKAVSWKSYFLDQETGADGHRATIFIRATQSSPPAFGEAKNKK